MMNTSVKIAVIIGFSIAAIAISIAAIFISTQSISHTNSQSTLQSAVSHYQGKKREFWMFDSEIPDLNETQMGMPHDVYSMSNISVYRGDDVVIHFFNVEPQGGDNHSFTIFDKPYDINVVVTPGQNKTITFDANTTGIFSYYCTFHQPTMRGQLLVQAPPY